MEIKEENTKASPTAKNQQKKQEVDEELFIMIFKYKNIRADAHHDPVHMKVYYVFKSKVNPEVWSWIRNMYPLDITTGYAIDYFTESSVPYIIWNWYINSEAMLFDYDTFIFENNPHNLPRLVGSRILFLNPENKPPLG
jgi:hypothetical protein